MFAREKMTKRLYFASPEEDLLSVYARMVELNVRHMLVIESGKMVGILSDRDMLLYAKPGRSYDFPEGLSVREVMAKDPIHGTPDMSIAAIAQTMLEHRIDALPVLRIDGGVMGLITTTDLLRLIANHDLEAPRLQASAEPIGSYAWELCEDII